MPAGVNLDEVVAWVGPTCHLVQYALRQRQMVNQVAVFRSPAFESTDDGAFTYCADGSAFGSEIVLGVDGLNSALRDTPRRGRGG
ncbi:hypothetical protein AB0I53_20175 [Saccharopolyspora sp. NPDC050389]|uniref:hypothetical protein n=1 Tax=Saccharopolyspora sp. NPDC050389 TaxID=3155516 RepID=UPI00340E04EE